jgi:CHASE3 domain sensor protein
MSLRAKLLFGYLVFVAALVLLGGWSAWRLREMGSVSRRIISNNYDSVVAAQEMKESLERQDSAALFSLLGARDKAHSQLSEHRASFDSNFQKAENNITEIGEPDAVEAIKRDRASTTPRSIPFSHMSQPQRLNAPETSISPYLNRNSTNFALIVNICYS